MLPGTQHPAFLLSWSGGYMTTLNNVNYLPGAFYSFYTTGETSVEWDGNS